MIVVSANSRQFIIVGADSTFGVEFDSGAEIKRFQCPRYVGAGLDITGCFVRINYRNANGDIDSYLVQDMTVNGDNVEFNWVLSPRVTQYKGKVNFVLCVTGPDTKVAWHTTLGTGTVLEGLEPDSEMIDVGTADVVTQLITMVEAQTAAVESVGAEQIEVVKDAAADATVASKAEIEAKGVNTRNSIPEDYTALSEAVDTLTRGKAPGIVCEAAGESIVVNDASDMALCGLRVFGKSVQNGVPSPDAPVEIESIVEPVVGVYGRNLIEYPYSNQTVTANGVTYTPKEDGSVEVSGTCSNSGSWYSINLGRFLPKGTYVLSGVFDGIADTSALYGYVNDRTASKTLAIVKPSKTEAAFTVSEELANVGISIAIPVGETVSGTIKLQLESGTNATEYVSPKTTQTVNLTHTLPGIPVTSSGNYTDSNGQQWICDEVDFERGVYVQRIGSIDGYAGEAVTSAYLSSSGELSTGATVLYVLGTPVETALSETELAAYRALHSNKPTTTVLNDAGAHMTVDYVADTKLYIDNKIAALTV